MHKRTILLFAILLHSLCVFAQRDSKLPIIAYYTGNDTIIEKYNIGQLNQIIYGFGHLKNGLLHLERAKDTATLHKLVSFKKQFPQLKILISMGGWGSCATCSDVFSTASGRDSFLVSLKKVCDYFHLDGFDLDWEYPAIEGFPGHKYQSRDRQNVTSLLQLIRQKMGKKFELSFAAGGFQHYLDSSIEWQKVVPLINRINLMTYDLISGYANTTGHHTSLYSARPEDQSIDKAVSYLIKIGVPARKLVIGSAFYAKSWKNIPDTNHGLYQDGLYDKGISFKNFDTTFTAAKGWAYYWDAKAQAPYWYNAQAHLFATGDDRRSEALKTKYAIRRKLGGIMFWELLDDKFADGLVQTIYDTKMKD